MSKKKRFPQVYVALMHKLMNQKQTCGSMPKLRLIDERLKELQYEASVYEGTNLRDKKYKCARKHTQLRKVERIYSKK